MTDINFCPLNPALIELKDTLRLAASAFNGSTTDHRRAAVLWSLGAIGDYLRAVLGPQEGAALTPLNQLVYALVDLERGKTAKLLRAAKVKGRPRDSAGQDAFRAFGAVAMDLLMEGMVPRKQAARTVARALNQIGYRDSSGKTITAHQVEDWRDRILSDRGSEYEPTARFHRVKQALLESSEPPKSAAISMLHRLPLIAPPEIPSKPPSLSESI